MNDARWEEKLVYVLLELAEVELKNNEYLKTLSTLEKIMEQIDYSTEHDIYGRVQQFYAMVYKHQNQYQQAKKAAIEALDFYQLRRDQKKLYQIRDLLGEIFFLFYKFEDAQKQWELSRDIAFAFPDKKERSLSLAKIYFKLSRMLLVQTKYKQARSYYFKALTYCKIIRDEALICRCIAGIGASYHLENRFNIALRVYEQVYEMACKRGDKVLIGRILHSYGDIATKTYKFEEAQINYERSLELSEEKGDFLTTAATLLEMGRLHMKINPELTRKFCEEAIDKLIENITADTRCKCERLMGKALYLMALYYSKFKDYERAMSNLFQAKEIFQKLGMEKEKKRANILYNSITEQINVTQSPPSSKSQVLSIKLGII